MIDTKTTLAIVVLGALLIMYPIASKFMESFGSVNKALIEVTK